MKTIERIRNLFETRNLTDAELKQILESSTYDDLLFDQAARKRREVYGDAVYIRGLIEFTNYCRNNCYYCGIRRDNRKAKRYRLSQDEILACCEEGERLGFRTFVLQGGEDPYYTDARICAIVAEIRRRFPDCAITLSLGEKSKESYQAYFDAGANRYLLRHETANSGHYQKLHPNDMRLENRKRCLFDLKEIGYQVGSGFMVGSPYQTTENLIDDIRFLQELKPDMIGIGPYITHADTPFSAFPSGSLAQTLRLIAILRLLFPYALIPATTALGTVHPQGRELGLKAGANVVMPNLSPVGVRKLYALYENKICTGEEAAQCRGCLERRVLSAGYRIVTAVGDAIRRRRKTGMKNKQKKRALIAMSGGVDSSLAAKQMIDRGFECIGCMMKLYQNEDVGNERSRTCCSLEDAEDARSVAYRLNMPFYVFNFTDTFRNIVIRKFIASYENGITPNPCIDCNRYIKFDKLFERAADLGCDYIVTGHYARIEEENGKFLLKKAVDETKDQSYVLYSMTQKQLARAVFPLGDMRKSEVRTLAAQNGFINADKPDSQDICFVPDGDYARAIVRLNRREPLVGNFVDKSGTVLGQHRGVIHYTVGQRRGLAVSAAQPLYVCDIDPKSREIVLGDATELRCSEAEAADFNWISGIVPKTPFRCKVKIRYRQKEQPAMVLPIGERRVRIVFDEPQRAVTPGQAAVLYDGDTVLGGGTIQRKKST